MKRPNLTFVAVLFCSFTLMTDPVFAGGGKAPARPTQTAKKGRLSGVRARLSAARTRLKSARIPGRGLLAAARNLVSRKTTTARFNAISKRTDKLAPRTQRKRLNKLARRLNKLSLQAKESGNAELGRAYDKAIRDLNVAGDPGTTTKRRENAMKRLEKTFASIEPMEKAQRVANRKARNARIRGRIAKGVRGTLGAIAATPGLAVAAVVGTARGIGRVRNALRRNPQARLRQLDAQLVKGDLVAASKVVEQIESDAAATTGARGVLAKAKAVLARRRLRKAALREGRAALREGLTIEAQNAIQDVNRQASEFDQNLKTERDQKLAEIKGNSKKAKDARAKVLEDYAQEKAQLDNSLGEYKQQLTSNFEKGRQVLEAQAKKGGLFGRFRARRALSKLDRALFSEVRSLAKQGPDGVSAARVLLMTARNTGKMADKRGFRRANAKARSQARKSIRKAIKEGYADGVELGYEMKWAFERDVNPDFQPSEKEQAKMQRDVQKAGSNIAGKLLARASWIMKYPTAALRTKGWGREQVREAVQIIDGLAREGKITRRQKRRNNRIKKRLMGRGGFLRLLAKTAALPITVPLKLINYLTIRQVREAIYHQQGGVRKPPGGRSADLAPQRYQRFLEGNAPVATAQAPHRTVNPMTGE